MAEAKIIRMFDVSGDGVTFRYFETQGHYFYMAEIPDDGSAYSRKRISAEEYMNGYASYRNI